MHGHLTVKNSSVITSRQKRRVLYMKNYVHLWSYLAELFSEWEIFQTKFVEKKHVLRAIYFLENRAIFYIVDSCI